MHRTESQEGLGKEGLIRVALGSGKNVWQLCWHLKLKILIKFLVSLVPFPFGIVILNITVC